MVWEFLLAYRYSNGELEGFAGCALTSSEVAKEDALRKVRRKLEHVRHARPDEPPFDMNRVLTKDWPGMTEAEKAQLKKDWEISKRAGNDC